jgi:hypothetical protein
MTHILSEARQLAELGFAVHWLVSPLKGGKAPVRRSWAVEPYQPPAALWATYRGGFNVGVHTGQVAFARHCFVVLDIDDERAYSFALERAPRTPLAVYTKRGEQWYYRHPGHGVVVPTRQHIDGYKLDLRGEGGQVVCPPSIHESGHVYRWLERPTQELLAALPVWSPTWFPTPVPAPAQPPRDRGLQPIGEGRRAFARGCGFAKRWTVAEEGEGRGTQTYKLACTLIYGLSLDEETTFEIMSRFWNQRLPQPYDEASLRRKTFEAAKAQRATQRLVERGA